MTHQDQWETAWGFIGYCHLLRTYASLLDEWAPAVQENFRRIEQAFKSVDTRMNNLEVDLKKVVRRVG